MTRFARVHAQFRWMVICALGLLAAACASDGAVSPPGDRVGAAANIEEAYRLGVGDKVRVLVFNEPGLSGEFSVGANGALSLPLIGDLAATGKTVDQVSNEVQAKLGDGYLRDPKVSMEVTAYRPYYILGEVKAPGTYPYVNGLTVMNAVASAQGFTPRANQGRIFIRRRGEDQEVAYKLTPDLRVYPGDTIRLGERYF
ncbi:polysaccharide biosynthesis/export family protein [Sphingomonas sp.]|jgi:polysaccharide export outer membrane protein|uniref:polysaccharide biosynthesis/export family protein n=1 Tax=Sphingomonas sp. TaxID=28214 RepID=UPI0035C86A93